MSREHLERWVASAVLMLCFDLFGGDHPTFRGRVPSVEQPFYDGTYAVALVGALEVWRGAQADPGEAWKSYRTALTHGSTQTLRTLFASAGASWPFTPEAVHGAMTIVDAAVKRALT